MAWCFSTRASVATALTTHPCVSRCLRVNLGLGVVDPDLCRWSRSMSWIQIYVVVYLFCLCRICVIFQFRFDEKSQLENYEVSLPCYIDRDGGGITVGCMSLTENIYVWEHLHWTLLVSKWFLSAYCIHKWLCNSRKTWWHNQMETLSVLLALCAGNSPVSGEFPSQRPVTWSFNVFIDLCLNKKVE